MFRPLAWCLCFTLSGLLLADDPAPASRALAIQPVQGAERRVALVIGNGAYADAPLKNPVQDARAMARVLETDGFKVLALENATLQQMREGLREFGGRIAQGGVGLFYFAGHGMQVKGRNYLIPVGADIQAEDEVAGAALDVDSVLAKLETARNRLNILILDACRNDPFRRSFRSASQGLAPLDAPVGTFIAFATAPGRTAADGGAAGHGLYTEQLLQAMQVPGVKLEDTFKRVLTGVRHASNGQQVPWTSSSVEGDFFFRPGEASAAAGPAPVPAPPPAAPPDAAAAKAPAQDLSATGGGPAVTAGTRIDPFGFSAAEVTPELAGAYGLETRTGFVVASVDPDGPAGKAGMREGDLVEGVNRTRATRMDVLAHAAAEAAETRGRALVWVRRKGARLFLVLDAPAGAGRKAGATLK